VSWKRPLSKSGMNVFTCDYKHYTCAAEFRSASVKSVLATQLRIAAWSIVVGDASLAGGVVKHVESIEGAHPRRFLCPSHGDQKPKMP
jgi:hypothetical protein